jgi:hypothetical protein
MILYHFTSATHLPRILADGYLKVAESNMSRTREHAGPDVVWLTRNPDGAVQGWKDGSAANKTEIRFTVDVPGREAHRWTEWSARRGIDPKWAQALTLPGFSSWYVVERPVPVSEWVGILDTRTGEDIALPSAVGEAAS